MLSDPQSITLNSVAKSLPSISRDGRTSIYSSDDGLTKLTVAHAPNGKAKTRSVIRLDTIDTVANPLVTGVNLELDIQVYLVIVRPNVGLSLASIKDKAKGLITLMTASSDAVLTKVLGGES